VTVDFDEESQWIAIHRGAFDVLANLADHPQSVPAGAGEVVFSTEPGTAIPGPFVSEPQLLLPARSARIISLR
jgi:maltooligosyltrehalose trehalohydrolase